MGCCCCFFPGARSGGDLLCLLALLLGFLLPACRTRLYTNHWAVRIAGGLPEANRIAGKYGYLNLGQVTLWGCWGEEEEGNPLLPPTWLLSSPARLTTCPLFL